MRKEKRSRLALAIGAAFCAFGLVAAIGSWGAYLADSRILEHGARVEARVLGKDVLFAADGDSDFMIDYVFELPDGTRELGHRGVPRPLWQSVREGGTVTVLYSPDNPRRNFPLGAGVTSLGLTVFVSAMGAVFAAVGSLLLRGYFRSGRGDA